MAFRWFLVLALSLMAMQVTSPQDASAGGAGAASPAGADVPDSTVRPGPDILYWEPPSAPQLENTGVWQAEPILVSGTSAYREGEFLYQDFIYDDSGAYPDEPATFAGNAADFVEIRLEPLPQATAVRITYNSLLDPEVVATTIALGDSPDPVAMPHGARARMPAEVFVTVHGTTGDALDAVTGEPRTRPTVAVDPERRQVDVRIPYSTFDPRGRTAVRIAAATGVWDPDAASFAKDGDGAAFYNLGFRYGQELSGFVTAAQEAALASGDLGEFFAEVDFKKLRAGVRDDSGVPTAGPMNIIRASHFETVQGRGNSVGGAVGDFACDDTADGCTYQFAGQLQPYRLDVPEGPPPPQGWGLVLNMHGAGSHHNSFNTGLTNGSVGQAAAKATVASLGNAWDGAVVLAPLARGESYFYWGQAGADVWESIADVMRRYPIDPARHVASGSSMGGCGSYKFGVQFPDFFTGIYPNIGCSASEVWLGPPVPTLGGPASESWRMFASLRHVPVMALNAVADPLVPASQKYQATMELERLGYRFDDWYFCDDVGCSHTEYRHYVAEEFEAWTQALSPLPVDPAHVTYVANSVMNEPRYGLNSDHAYWVSDVQVRDTTSPPPVGTIGTVDVYSHGVGVGDAPANITNHVVGNGPGTHTGVYNRHTKTWGAPPTVPVSNQLDITATNIASVTIDPVRARIGCDAALTIDSDGPLEVVLLGCPSPEESTG